MKQYENRLIAFIDILGFKSIIDSSINNEVMQNHIYSILNYNAKLQDENYSKTFRNKSELNVEITVFSDSIVISYPGNYAGGLFELLMDCVFISIDLLSHGILIRGGITYGPLIHEKTICFGPAMNEAYRLESHVAVYPRIVVDNSAIEHGLSTPGLANNQKQEAEFLNDLLNLEDGLFYLDFLSQSQEVTNGNYISLLKIARELIINNLANTTGSVHTKYLWFKSYYNKVIEKKINEEHYKEFLIP